MTTLTLKTIAKIETVIAPISAKMEAGENVTVKVMLDAFNEVAESMGATTLKKFKTKADGETRFKNLVKMIGEEKAKLEKAKEDKKKAAGNGEAPKSTGRKSTAIIATVNGAEIKLVNSVSTKIFKDVKKIEVSRPLSDTAYFNSAWFAKREIEVVVKKEEK